MKTASGGLLVQARSGPDQESLQCPGDQDKPRHC